VSPLRGLSIFPPTSVGLLCCTHGYYAVGTPCLTIQWDGCVFDLGLFHFQHLPGKGLYEANEGFSIFEKMPIKDRQKQFEIMCTE
jgi:hypothetical protein